MTDLLKTLPEIDPAELARLEAQWQAEAARPKPEPRAAFPTTGLRPLKTEPMPPSTALTATPKPRTSGTIGALKPGLSPASLIGALRGGLGAVTALNLPPVYTVPQAESQEERACRHMSSLLVQAKSPSPSDKECASEMLLALWGPTGDQRDRKVMGMLQAFFTHFPRQRGEAELEVYVLNDWLDDLAEFPLFAIREALFRGRRAGLEFRPPVAKVREWCASYSRKYRELSDEHGAA